MTKTSDLTDDATLRAFRPIRNTQEATTTRIALLISAMSSAIRRYTQREFLGKNLGEGFNPDATETRTFAYDGSGYLSMAPFEARAITTVQLEGDELEAVTGSDSVGSTRYLAQPPQKTTEGTYLYLTLPTIQSCRDRDLLVEVTAKWGIVDLPDDVELAALHAVADAYGNPEGAASRNLGDGLILEEGNDEASGSLPRASRALLSALVRRV